MVAEAIPRDIVRSPLGQILLDFNKWKPHHMMREVLLCSAHDQMLVQASILDIVVEGARDRVGICLAKFQGHRGSRKVTPGTKIATPSE